MRNIQLLTVIFFLFFFLGACRKSDNDRLSSLNSSNQEYLLQKFLQTTDSTNTTVKKLIAFVAQRKDYLSFAKQVISESGLPLWDKALMIKKSAKLSAKGSSAAADTNYVFVPLVPDGQQAVEGVFACKTFGDSVKVNYLSEKEYERFGFDASKAINATDFISLLMYLENSVFGTQSFIINDQRIFPNFKSNASTSKKKILTVRNNNQSKDQNKISNRPLISAYYVTVEICNEFWGYGCPRHTNLDFGQLCGDANGYYSYFECTNYVVWVDEGSGGGSTGGGTGGTGSGSTGGNGGTTAVSSTISYLSQTLNLLTDQLLFLNPYPNLCEELYNYLNTTDGNLSVDERNNLAKSHILYLSQNSAYLTYCNQLNEERFSFNGFPLPWFQFDMLQFDEPELYSNIQNLRLDAKQAFYLLNDSIRSSEIKNYLDNSVTPIEEKKIQGLKHLNTLLKYGGYENFIQNYSVTHGSNLMWWENANFEEYCEYWGVWLDETKPIAPNTKGSEQFEYIDNVEDYLKCFNDGKVASSYELKVYVDDPPGDGVFQPNYITKGIKDQGHTFIEIIKNNNDGTKVSQLIGFYPDPNSLPTLQNPATLGKLKNDSNHEYDSKVEIIITQENFNTVLGKVRSYALAGYDFEQFNCTSFAKEISASIGVTMPSGYRTFGTPEGGRTYAGVCPSGLHIDIFNWPNKPSNVHNVQKYTFAQNAPVGKGKCQ